MKKRIKKILLPFLRIIAKIYVNRKTKRYNKNTIKNSRWFKFTFAECGENLRIYGSPLIQKPELIHIGNNCAINEGAQINPNGVIYIGNNVTISSGVKIISNTLDISNWKKDRLSNKINHIGKIINIADGAWLCSNSVILPGVNIYGKGVIVAAGAVVTKDITEDFVIVGGIPAKIIQRL